MDERHTWDFDTNGSNTMHALLHAHRLRKRKVMVTPAHSRKTGLMKKEKKNVKQTEKETG